MLPDAMITQFGAIGTPDMVRGRFRKYRDAGINSLSLRLADGPARIEALEQTLDLLKDID